MSPKMNINWKTLGLALIFVAGLTFIYYVVSLIANENYAWIAVLLVLVNVYLIYRVQIRRTISGKIYGKDDFTNSQHRPSQKVEQDDSPDIETQQQAFDDIRQEYDDCPNCDEEIIPGLTYCENCGHQFSE